MSKSNNSRVKIVRVKTSGVFTIVPAVSILSCEDCAKKYRKNEMVIRGKPKRLTLSSLLLRARSWIELNDTDNAIEMCSENATPLPELSDATIAEVLGDTTGRTIEGPSENDDIVLPPVRQSPLRELTKYFSSFTGDPCTGNRETCDVPDEPPRVSVCPLVECPVSDNVGVSMIKDTQLVANNVVITDAIDKKHKKLHSSQVLELAQSANIATTSDKSAKKRPKRRKTVKRLWKVTADDLTADYSSCDEFSTPCPNPHCRRKK